MTSYSEISAPWKAYCKSCAMSFGVTKEDLQKGAHCPLCKQKVMPAGQTVFFIDENRCMCLVCEKSFGVLSSVTQPLACPHCAS
jgi:DNA-directed RNA polymerase subunit RPC12/RpoP